MSAMLRPCDSDYNRLHVCAEISLCYFMGYPYFVGFLLFFNFLHFFFSCLGLIPSSSIFFLSPFPCSLSSFSGHCTLCLSRLFLLSFFSSLCSSSSFRGQFILSFSRSPHISFLLSFIIFVFVLFTSIFYYLCSLFTHPPSPSKSRKNVELCFLHAREKYLVCLTNFSTAWMDLQCTSLGRSKELSLILFKDSKHRFL